MSLINIILLLLLLGLFLYCIESFLPIDFRIKRILEAVMLIAVLVYILKGMGILGEPFINR
jgi:hypothetical protein